MTLFVVIATAPPSFDAVGKAVAERYKDNFLKLNNSCWVVADTATAKEVSDKLNVTPADGVGSAVVASVSNYYGRASTDIWEWMKSRLSAAPTHG